MNKELKPFCKLTFIYQLSTICFKILQHMQTDIVYLGLSR